MKRREFIAKGALVAGVMSFVPSVIQAMFYVRSHWVALPKPMDHVRHGLYSREGANVKGLPPWIKNFRIDRFYANGIGNGSRDMRSIAFEVEGRQICLSGVNDHWELGMNGEKVKTCDFGDYSLMITKSVPTRHRDHDMVVIPLSDPAKAIVSPRSTSLEPGILNDRQSLCILKS